MTLDQFVRKLGKESKGVKWTNHFGDMRLITRDGKEYCPITFLYKKKTDIFKDTLYAEDKEVYRALGLNYTSAAAIIVASDTSKNYLPTDRKRRLRSRLLKALRLERD